MGCRGQVGTIDATRPMLDVWGATAAKRVRASRPAPAVQCQTLETPAASAALMASMSSGAVLPSMVVPIMGYLVFLMMFEASLGDVGAMNHGRSYRGGCGASRLLRPEV